MNTLLIFAKEPQQAKQRLRKSLPGAQVTCLVSAFLRDILAVAASLDDVVVKLAFSPRSSEPKFSGYFKEFALEAPNGLVLQRGRSLGARLEAAFKDAFREGARRVIAIGTDSPSMPPDSIRAGFRLLKECECVLGPSLDGGYYLLGLSRECPHLFRGIEWSSPAVYRDTVQIIQCRGITYRELPVWYDVDTAEDLEFLVRDINQFRLAGDEYRARHTEDVLAKILQVDS